MSISSILFMAICIGAYKLGHFNATRPGQIWEWCIILWKWMRT